MLLCSDREVIEGFDFQKYFKLQMSTLQVAKTIQVIIVIYRSIIVLRSRMTREQQQLWLRRDNRFPLDIIASFISRQVGNE